MKERSVSRSLCLLVLAVTALSHTWQDAEAQGSIKVCIKSGTVADRWDDANANGRYDPGEYYDPMVTGYSCQDVGAAIILRIETSRDVIDGFVLPITSPRSPDRQVNWLLSCAYGQLGDSLRVGAIVPRGTTIKAVNQLIAQDPLARWDADTNTIAYSAYGRSPRSIRLPLFDPGTLSHSGRRVVTVTKTVDLFVEGFQGTEISTRLVCVDCED